MQTKEQLNNNDLISQSSALDEVSESNVCEKEMCDCVLENDKLACCRILDINYITRIMFK